ncbi:MAG: RNA 2'-phosphotransferase [Lachnospiraceae bacterium]|nr:RNA 2'-phosphotransferase [Lachnospiraceae bacterium]
MNKEQIGKYLSLILRHKPETIGIELDSHGWASVDELIDGVKKTYPEISFAFLEEIVSSDNKQRYSFNDDKTKIRANQGHSIGVDLELKPVCPPDILYHGTGEKYVNSIDSEGLIKKSRQYVHLSADIDIAKKVGIRHGKPVIYLIDSKKMYEDGYRFYLSENGVWLTNDVPVQYLKKVNN